MSDHVQVKVDMLGQEVEVDEGMIPLLQAIWAHGIETGMSCQGDEDRVWIQFEMPCDGFEYFVRLLVDDAEYWKAFNEKKNMNSLTNAVFELCRPPFRGKGAAYYRFEEERAWEYDVEVYAAGVAMSVRIPRHDVDRVIARLKEAKKNDS